MKTGLVALMLCYFMLTMKTLVNCTELVEEGNKAEILILFHA